MENTTTQDEFIALVVGEALRLVTKAQQPDVDTDALRRMVADAAESLRAIGRDPGAAHQLLQTEDLADTLLSDYGKRQAAAAANGGVVGVRTGLDHLDETLNGLEPGKLYMLAAMPGTGKTTLALQWAATVAQSGSTALYLSLENDSIDLARKLACRLGQVSYSSALKGKLSPQEWAGAVHTLHKLQGRLFLSTPRAAMPDLSTLAEGFMARTGAAPSLIVVDYLQAWVKRMSNAAGAGAGSDIRERIDRFTPQLRAIGEEYGCAVLAISSQNRAGQEKGGMGALKESGDLEYNADAIMTLSRASDNDAPYDSTRDPRHPMLKLVVDKNRQGMTGTPINLIMDADYCMIEEVSL